ncbi:MAG TPA: hypothetical protein VG738_23005 [Chitinophagaceae bacterium]|nr:hypothetical protein [Chitinophagaceae bacterium]
MKQEITYNRCLLTRAIVKPLVLVLMLLPAFQLQANTYYFSQSAGSDANNGLTTTTPKKSIGAALTLMVSGDTILFKRGDEWYLPLNSLDLRGKSGFTLGAYDSGAQPVIAGMSILTNASWSYDGSLRWSYSLSALGFTDLFRVVVNCTTVLNVSDEGKSNAKTSVTSDSEYYYDKSAEKLYLYTGSSTTGPQYVEVIPASSSLPQGISTVLMHNTSNVIISDIDFRGGSKWNIVHMEAPNRNIDIDNCTMEEASKWASGILVSDTMISTDYNAHITITNCIVDKSFTSFENKDTFLLSGDGIFCLNGVDTGNIAGNTVLNWGHVGISLTSYYAQAPYIHGVHHVTVEANDVSAGNSGYMHALDVSGLAGLTTYNIIKRNNFHNYTTTCHLQGSNNLFFSNIFNGVIGTTHPGQSFQPFGGDMVPWRRPEGIMEARDNWFLNNTIANTGGYSLWLGWGDSAMPYNANITNIKIANNILYSYADFPFKGVPLGLDVDTFATGTNYYRNNNFWNGSSTDVVARFKKYPYLTASGLNSALLCSTYCSNNGQLDPQFTGYFTLGSGADASLKTGGIDYSSYISAYIPLTEFVDYNNVQWRTSTPSRGAIQY